MGEIDFGVPEIELDLLGSVTLAPGAVASPFWRTDRVEVAWVVAGTTHVTSEGTTYDLGPRSVLYLPPGRFTQFRFSKDMITTSCFAQFRMADPPKECVIRRLTGDEVTWS